MKTLWRTMIAIYTIVKNEVAGRTPNDCSATERIVSLRNGSALYTGITIDISGIIYRFKNY